MKLSIGVQRIQYPVGHGGFHAGCILVKKQHGNELLRKDYVYDCGSEAPVAFDRSLRKHNKSSEGKTDILFVSHLDSDHVNKIDRLMGAQPAKIVVLPYLEDEDLSSSLCKEIDSGRITASIREYIVDPVEWWKRRGAETVIFVEPGDGDERAPGGVPPSGVDPDRRGPQPGASGESAKARLACILAKPRRHAPKGFAPVPYDAPLDTDALPTGGILAGCTTRFVLECSDGVSSGWISAGWILLPYVHPVDALTRVAFKIDVEAELRKSFPGVSFADAILRQLTQNKRSLVQLYRRHFDVDQNSISMSLYSGPEQGRRLYEMQPRPWYGQRCFDGWLSTGDSRLKKTERRRAWLQFFGPLSDVIGILALPHHGSFHDFHDEILDFERLSIALATTEPDRHRIFGLDQTLERVEDAGIEHRTIDDVSHNAFRVECEWQWEV